LRRDCRFRPVSAGLVRAAALLLVAVLGGCVSAEELRARDEAACTSYGFQAGTPDFASCLQRESLARRYAAPQPGWYAPGGGFGPGWYPPPPGWMW
jgi:hypothetical protein